MRRAPLAVHVGRVAMTPRPKVGDKFNYHAP